MLGGYGKPLDYPFSVIMRAYIGSCCDSAASNTMTIAYMLDSSGFVSLFSYATIPYGFLADIFIFRQKFIPVQLICAIFIVTVTIAVAYIKL